MWTPARQGLRPRPGRLIGDHPMADRLAVACVFNEGAGYPINLLSNQHLRLGTSQNQPPWAPRHGIGPGLEYDGTTARDTFFDNLTSTITVDRSVFFGFRLDALPAASPARGAALGGWSQFALASFAGIASVNSSGNGVYYDFDTGAKTATTGNAIAVGEPATVGGTTRSGSTIQAFLQGLGSATTGFGTSTTWASSGLSLGVIATASWSRLAGVMALALAWTRTLQAEEFRFLHDDFMAQAYEWLEEDPLRRYFGPSMVGEYIRLRVRR